MTRQLASTPIASPAFVATPAFAKGTTNVEARRPAQRERGAKGGRNGMRARILQDVARILVDRPVHELNMQAIVRLTGVSLWALRYHFGTFAELFKAAAMHVVDGAETALLFLRPQPESVIGTIHYYASSLREVVRSSEYRDMIYLVVRHGNTHDWLRDAYDRRITGKICGDLSELVLEVSERLGAPVLFKDGVTRRFHRRIETEFALRSLLSPLDALPDDEGEALLGEIVREAFLGTYCFDWQGSNAA